MSQSEDTKSKLIRSAIKVFSEKGYFNAKVSDIVKDAGYAQGTFYLYFSSKEDIFLHIVKLIVGQIDELIQKYKNKKDKQNISQTIYSFSEEMFLLLYSYKEVAYIFFFQLLCMQENFKEVYVSTYKKFIDFYTELFCEFDNKDIIAGLIVSYGEKLLKFDLLIEKKDINKVISEFNQAVKLILRGIVK